MAIIFHTINGIGLGHLSRQLQIAREVRRKLPNSSIYFLTSAEWHQWLRQEKIPFYHIPSAPEYRVTGSLKELKPLPEDVLRQCSPPGFAENLLRLVVKYHWPAAIVFDTFFPERETLTLLADGTAVFCVIDAYSRLNSRSIQKLLENGGVVLVAADDLEVDDWASHPGVVHVGRILHEADNIEKQDRQFPKECFRVICTQGGGGFKKGNSVFYEKNTAFSSVVASVLSKLRKTFGDLIKVTFVLGPYGSVEDAKDLPPWVEIMKTVTNMPALLRQYDLLISRGGYSAVSDSISSGCPGVFLPIREPVEDQTSHIADLVKSGSGFVSDHDAKKLSEIVANLIREPEKLIKTRKQLIERKSNAKGAQKAATYLCSSLPNKVLLSCFNQQLPRPN